MTSLSRALALLIVCLSSSSLASAQTAPDPAESASAPRVLIKTVVIGLQARRGIDEGLAQALSDVVQGVFAADPGRVVLGRQDIAQVLGFESERQAAGCDDASCLSEVASALDADRLITGSMDRLGTSYLIVINEFDARKLLPLGRVERQLAVPEEQLVGAVREAARALLSETQLGAVVPEAAASGAVGSALPSAAAPATEPNKAEVAAYESSLFWNATGGVTKIIGGTGCVVLGIPTAALGLFGLTVPTDPSGAITDDDIAFGTFFSVAGGACCLVGAGLIGWGVADFLWPPEPPGARGEDDAGEDDRASTRAPAAHPPAWLARHDAPMAH